MIIQSLKLKNIRSYVDQSFEFPEGSLLLSGDIGCGKTTVLLAIEFAVFGIMKGVLSGNTLLRHGSDYGSVELKFKIKDQAITIKRSLKRGFSGVVQEPGIITTNNEVFEGTTQELKAKILALLGYPEELLTKSKSLIFRYTVFTPQDEMKKILYEKREDRMDILRKLFNIDKYKRIRENSLNYLRDLRLKINSLQAKLEAMPEKNQELENYNNEISELKQAIETEQKLFDEKKSAFEKANQDYETIASELETLRKTESEFEIRTGELNNQKDQSEQSISDLEKINNRIQELLSTLEGFDIQKADSMKDMLKEKKEELKKINWKEEELNKKITENNTKKIGSEKIFNQIKELDTCPLCHQKVTPEHINEVTTKEMITISACNSNLTRLFQIKKLLSMKKDKTEQEIEGYIQGEKEFEAKKAKLDSLKEKKEQKKSLEEKILLLKESIIKSQSKIEQIKKELEKGKDKKQELEKAKRLLEESREEKNNLEKNLVSKKTKQETINQVLERLKQEINRMKQEEEQLTKIIKYKNMFQEEFINLVESMEKNILSRIYTEFNSFFQEWFATLLEDETISVRLDEYFSPIIEQNGYETWIENLSGGEKTSIALSYRLALNKVINDFMSSINTRDLIILDEPTEGFSSEQLDRVREVLNQTNVKQIIIVSHEAKMEGFVDNIIRISKSDHESAVVA